MLSTSATSSIPGRFWISRARMRCAGISIPIRRPGCPTGSMMRRFRKSQRKFMGTLWNTYAFYVLYAEIDGFDPTKYELRKEGLPVMDRWVLSRLNSLVRGGDGVIWTAITSPRRPGSSAEFVDELSNWYVRRCRDRYWGKRNDPGQDRRLYDALYRPGNPLPADRALHALYGRERFIRTSSAASIQNAPESVHLCSYPVGG